jgi:TonB family protein
MIASWMLHAVVVTVPLALAARAAESALAAYRLPVRWAWLGAAVGALALPAAAAADLPRRLAALLPSSAAAGGGSLPSALGDAALAAPPEVGGWGLSLPTLPAAVEPVALAAWAAGSLVLGLLVLRSWLEIRRRRRGWERTRRDGAEILVSKEFGPAAVGLLDPVPVLPGWVLDLPPDERRLVLRHELEHREAGDPALLGFGVAVLVAAPWNPALWWIARRLRLAVELDCDRRVLADGTSPGDYGALLLEITRSRRGGPLPVAALGERSSRLERRIRAMTEPIPTFRTARAACLALVGAGLLVAACDAPTPAEDPDGAVPEATASRSADAPGDPAGGATDRPRFVPRDEDPRAVNDREIVRMLRDRYPAGLREAGLGGTATVWLFVDREGQVTKVRMQESSGRRALDRAAMSVASSMEFEPALRDGAPVGVWVSRRITFAPPGADGAEDAGGAAAAEGADDGRSVGDVLAERPRASDRTADDVSRADGPNLELDGGQVPLIYVDGERVQDASGALDDLRPDEIESIEVIKGPAAVGAYGEEGRDGVIRITTKAAAGSSG